MTPLALWRNSSLKVRVLALVLATLVAIALPASAVFHWMVNGTVVKLGTLFAEKQILFDRFRGLEPLMQEVKLAETLARAPVMLEWAEDESDPEKARRGLAELEHYRRSFGDRSYFMVLDRSGNYYFNDKDNAYEGKQLRYRISADNPQDAWYFKTRSLNSGCHLNVNHDEKLDVTKVWINCVVQRDRQVLGIIGTGVDLTQFIREVVEFPQTGVQSMFVDLQGAVQAHRDPRLVEMRSLTKDIAEKQTIFRLLDRESDRIALRDMMQQVARGDTLVLSRFMKMGGREVLVGVGFLDRIGWFNVTVMDVDVIIDRNLFAPIGALMAVILLAAAVLMTVLFKRYVLNRLERVEAAVTQVRAGDFAVRPSERGNDEIARLARKFREMAQAVGDNTGRLEAMVAERTAELERLARHDPLTSVLNRRGFDLAWEQLRQRSRAGTDYGIVIIDLDRFKEINDEHGHHAGDEALVACVQRILSVLGPDDICARWGGDEFILILADSTPVSLAGATARIVGLLRDAPVRLVCGLEIAMTASIGGTLLTPGEALSDATARADKALYQVKRGGRNGFLIQEAPSDDASSRAA